MRSSKGTIPGGVKCDGRPNSLLLLLVIISLGILVPRASAQSFRLQVTQPDLAKYPSVTARYYLSGGDTQPVKISAAEDGVPVTIIQSSDCTSDTALALVIALDVSSSMRFSAAAKNPFFTNAITSAISTLIGGLPPGSEYALVPFTDTVKGYLPGFAQKFYQQNPTDSARLIDSLKNTVLLGDTWVDGALAYALDVAASSKLSRRAVVLITDDIVYEVDSLAKYYRAESTRLFALSIYPQTLTPTKDLAERTAGVYFDTPDSNQYIPAIDAILTSLRGKSCLITYISPLDCPWNAYHTVIFRADQGLRGATATAQYSLGRNRGDTAAPKLTSTKSGYQYYTQALDTGHCPSLLQKFDTISTKNFTRVGFRKLTAALGYDSLVVIDTFFNASAAYYAVDSAGNRTEISITYTTSPDTAAPRLSVTKLPGHAFRFDAADSLAWDRGLKELLLLNEINISIDSIRRYSRNVFSLWISVVDSALPASFCVQAVDSFAHTTEICQAYEPGKYDELPPMLEILPMDEPLGVQRVLVHEDRPRDRGIALIEPFAISNVTAVDASIFTTNAGQARFIIGDTLYAASGRLSATDSSGNVAIDTFYYHPQPDARAPEWKVDTISTTEYRVTFTENLPWDRGLKSVDSRSGTANIVVTPSLMTRRTAAVRVMNSDRLTAARVTLVALDSAANENTIELTFDAQPNNPVLITFDTSISFSTTPAPALLQRDITIVNPNSYLVPITEITLEADLGFSLPNAFGFGWQPKEAHVFSVSFTPREVGRFAGVVNVLSYDDTVGRIHLSGTATSSMRVALDTIDLPKAGERGYLTLSLSSPLTPINLEPFEVTLSYNRDVITVAPSDTTINGFDVAYTPSESSMKIAFAPRAKFSKLSVDGKLRLPVASFIARDAASAVKVTTQDLEFVSTNSSPGLVRIGSACADSILRDRLRRVNPVRIVSVERSRNSYIVTLDVAVGVAVEGSLVSVAGQQRALIVQDGKNIVSTTELPSGVCLLVIRPTQAAAIAVPLMILH